MSQIRKIRNALRLSQAALGERLGMSQGNVSFYEHGQSVPPAVAQKLIEVAAAGGLSITFDHIYTDAPIPSADEVGIVGQIDGPLESVTGAHVAVAEQQVHAGTGPVVHAEEAGLLGGAAVNVACDVGVGLVGAHGGSHQVVDEAMVNQ